MADPSFLMLRNTESDTGVSYTILVHPSSGLVQADIPPVLRLTNPTIAGTGAVGSPITYTPGTNNAGVPLTAFWQFDDIVSALPATTPYVPVAADNTKRISAFEYMLNFPQFDMASGIITITNSGAAVFPVVLTQAQLDQLDMYEITDPADPSASTGGRMRLVVGTLPAWAAGPDFQATWASNTTEGGLPNTGDVIVAGGTYVKSQVQAVGVKRHNVIYAKRVSDGISQSVMPISGHTGGIAAHQLTITPTTADATRGQAIRTCTGLDNGTTPVPGIWPVPSTAAVTEAVDHGVVRFIETGGSGSNFEQAGAVAVMCAYALYKGASGVTVARVREQLNEFFTPAKTPFGSGGPNACRETLALAFFQIVLKTPAMALTADEIAKIECIRDALMIANAFTVGPNKTPEHLNMRGDTAKQKSTGSDIGTSPPLNVCIAACMMGPNAAKAFMDTFTMSAMRTRISALFGTSSTLYKTFNWRSQGVSQSTADGMYRANASSTGPSDAEVQKVVNAWKFFGQALPNIEAILFPPYDPVAKPDGCEGLDKTMPPTTFAKGSQPLVGMVQWAATDTVPANQGLRNQKIMVNGVERGYCYVNGAGTPHLLDVGCTIWDMACVDDGGLRMSYPYSLWSAWMATAAFIAMDLSGQVNLTTTKFTDWLTRWKKCYEVMAHFNTNNFNSIAHRTLKANGGGGTSDPNWFNNRANWKMTANMALWQAVNSRFIG